jgi:flagellar basal body-associated protein FliL
MKTKTLPKPTKFLLATALLSVFIGLFAITFGSGSTIAAPKANPTEKCSGLKNADSKPPSNLDTVCETTKVNTTNYCGDKNDKNNQITINIGCVGRGNPVTDLMFAIIRFLTNGVGIVIVGSLIYGGIMYSTSGDSPETNAKAKKRIRSNIVALMIFIFAYAILNYVIPVTVLK